MHAGDAASPFAAASTSGRASPGAPPPPEEPRGAVLRRQGSSGRDGATFLQRQDSASMQGSGYAADAPSDADSDIVLLHHSAPGPHHRHGAGGGGAAAASAGGGGAGGGPRGGAASADRTDSAWDRARRGRGTDAVLRRDSASDLVPDGPAGGGGSRRSSTDEARLGGAGTSSAAAAGAGAGAAETAAAAAAASAGPGPGSPPRGGAGQRRRASPLPRPPAARGEAAAARSGAARASDDGGAAAAAAPPPPEAEQQGSPGAGGSRGGSPDREHGAREGEPHSPGAADTLAQARAVVFSSDGGGARPPADCLCDSYQIASRDAKDPEMLLQARAAVLGRSFSGGSCGAASPRAAALSVVVPRPGSATHGAAHGASEYVVDSPRDRAERLAAAGLAEAGSP
ncbi:hypothetical protein Rsub_04409 [Raphidocelis subcapitata]|uniref:Uncharacterized protein n=1 Tax=Raphidocelis subcapitata TaxID=307507 RepID=A0A2V0NZG1_9CHLO|nr:hypothetical protein Rsub_04409 [Raphidocelis subcapitata]|eukprot:GBF92062.1 hypothetical protein Rsub_04409 [Raphidocelis subcapitata]